MGKSKKEKKAKVASSELGKSPPLKTKKSKRDAKRAPKKKPPPITNEAEDIPEEEQEQENDEEEEEEMEDNIQPPPSTIDENTIELWKSVFELEQDRFSFYDELFASGFVVDSMEVVSQGPNEPLEHFIEADFEELMDKDYGRVVMKTKNVYAGHFDECGYFTGCGRYVWVDGTVYEGEFKRGVMFGKGAIRWPDGSIYSGEFANAERAPGWNVYTTAEGFTYAGEWKGGLPEGQGKIWYDPEVDDTDYYEGGWLQGLQSGYGVRQYPNGDRYIGNWEGGTPSGTGTMIWLQERQVYKGQWSNGLPNGKGKHIWYLERTNCHVFPARHAYYGDWVDGQRDGIGEMIYPCGSTYNGRFKEGQRHGKGVFLNPAGALITGLFKTGELVGGSGVSLHAPTYDCDFGGLVEYLTSKFHLNVENEATEEHRLQETVIRFLEPLRTLYQRAGELSHNWGNNGLFPHWKKGSSGSDHRIPNHHENGVPPHMAGKSVKPPSPDGVYPVVRMGVWLLLKDCPKLTKDVTLAYFDKHFGETPSVSFQTRHNPFEPVLLWQFLQCLVIVGVAVFLEIPIHKRPRPKKEKKPKTVAEASNQTDHDQEPPQENNEKGTGTLRPNKKRSKKRGKRNKSSKSPSLQSHQSNQSQKSKKSNRSQKSKKSNRSQKSKKSRRSQKSKKSKKSRRSQKSKKSKKSRRTKSKKLRSDNKKTSRKKIAASNEEKRDVSESENEEEIEVDHNDTLEYEMEGDQLETGEDSENSQFKKNSKEGQNNMGESDWENEEGEEEDASGLFPHQTQNLPYKLSISEAFEAFLIEKLFPCLEVEPGINLPMVPNPLPPLRDMYDVFQKQNGGNEHISASDFMRTLLPHLELPTPSMDESGGIYWHRCPETIYANVDLNDMISRLQHKRQSLTKKQDDVNDNDNEEDLPGEELLPPGGLEEEEDNEDEDGVDDFLGGRPHNVSLSENIPIPADDDGDNDNNQISAEVMDFMSDPLPFEDKDLPQEPFLWDEDRKCIQLTPESETLNVAPELTSDDVVSILRALYPKLVGKGGETNVHFDMVFCDWLWGVSLVAKLCADREMGIKRTAAAAAPPPSRQSYPVNDVIT